MITIDPTIKVSDIMTSVVTFVQPDDIMTMVDDIFKTQNIHHIPVLDKDGKVSGIISKLDYFKVLHGITLFRTKKSELINQAVLRSLLVKEVMTRQVATLQHDTTLMVAAGYFRENLFHAIPIVDRNGVLQGIITTYDMLNYAYRLPGFLPE